MFDLRCMSYTSKGQSEVVAGGLQKSLLTINIDRGTVINEVLMTPGSD